jgi:hypothetical protein
MSIKPGPGQCQWDMVLDGETCYVVYASNIEVARALIFEAACMFLWLRGYAKEWELQGRPVRKMGTTEIWRETALL